MMIELFRTTLGCVYAVRVWRIVFYIDRGPPSLRFGGIVTHFGGGHRLAQYCGWRLAFVRAGSDR